MGIKKLICYEAFCSGCGERDDGGDSIPHYKTKEKAIVGTLEGSDWEVIDGELYCEPCANEKKKETDE